MLDELENIAETLGMRWGYGEDSDFDLLADQTPLTPDTAGPPGGRFLLFHSGYLEATLKVDAQGALEYTHNLLLIISISSKLYDLPDDKKSHTQDLDLQLRRVIGKLTKIGEIKSMRVQTGLNLTDANLDAVKLFATLLTPAKSLCNS